MDDDELTDFLAAYAEVCTEAGIDPLPADALAALARAMLTGSLELSPFSETKDPRRFPLNRSARVRPPPIDSNTSRCFAGAVTRH